MAFLKLGNKGLKPLIAVVVNRGLFTHYPKREALINSV